MTKYRGYCPELDGLRGIAILLVLLHHFWPHSGVLADPFLTKAAHLGWIGVDLFFVISGFLITGILLDTRGDAHYYRNFYVRRGLRIFPLYYVFLLAAWTVLPRLPESGAAFVRDSGSPLWYFLYMGNVREAITGVEPAYVLAPLWSLSIEEQFYITFPLVVALLGARRLWRCLWVLIAAAPLFRVTFYFLAPDNERIQYLATFSRMDNIAMGCLIATGLRLDVLRIPGKTLNRLLGAGAAVMALAFLGNGLDRTQPFCRIAGYSLTSAFFAIALMWTIHHRSSLASAFLRWGPLIGLGKICYGVYLLQRPAEVIVNKGLEVTGIEVDPTLMLPVKMTAALATAWVSWRLFEEPILRLKAYFASSRHPAGLSTDPEKAVVA